MVWSVLTAFFQLLYTQLIFIPTHEVKFVLAAAVVCFLISVCVH